jgi:hypothetical protein
MRCLGIALCLFSAVFAANPTFHKDVLPVLQKHCQECHRPGEVGPMPLLSYQQARPWAKSIKQAVATKKMPPWFADPAHGKFANDRSLTAAEIQTLTAWADSGAKEGNAKDAPKPVAWREGWNIGTPDVVLEIPAEFDVPANGIVEYQYFIVPTNFTEDKWIQVVEVRPGDRRVVHHAAVFLRPPGSGWLPGLKSGGPYTGKEVRGQGLFDELLDFHVPGSVPHALPEGQAKLVPKGTDLIFQMHYTPNGKSGRDKTRIGIVFSKEPPRERVFSMLVANQRIRIPPGDPAYKAQAVVTVQEGVKLVALNPHMHLRGKSYEFKAVYPTGETETLLNVPAYDFYWQLQYYLSEQKLLPPGTKIECNAVFDNSPNNPKNPDPTKEVRWGEQSFDEMLAGTIDVAFDAKMNVMELYRPKKRPAPGQ